MSNIIDRLVATCKAAVVNLEFCVQNHPQDANDKEVSEICIKELVAAVKEVRNEPKGKPNE